MDKTMDFATQINLFNRFLGGHAAAGGDGDEKAAVKLQGMFRGVKARRQLLNMRLQEVETIKNKLLTTGRNDSMFAQKVNVYWENVKELLKNADSREDAAKGLAKWRREGVGDEKYKHLVKDADVVKDKI
eukprot:2892370-Rhodomonas_salina.1